MAKHHRTGCCPAQQAPPQGGRGGGGAAAAASAPGGSEVPLAGQALRARHAGQAARRPGQGHAAGRSTPSTSTGPGMLYGRIVRSPHPHARIVSIDLSAAQKAPGVKAALVWRDPANPQRNKVMYQGDEVAAVAADTEEHAIDAARLVKVEYEVLPHCDPRRSGARRQRAGGLHAGNVAAGSDAGDRRSRRRASSRPRTCSRRRMRRT